MESIGAINLIYMLFFPRSNSTSSYDGAALSVVPFLTLPLWNKLVAALYILHYANRAVITPLFLAPSMSPIHAIMICMATAFNYVNSSCLAGWLLGYGSTPAGFDIPTSSPPLVVGKIAPYIPNVGFALFLIGMFGNVHAERTLFNQRIEEAHRRRVATTKGGKSTTTTTTTNSSSNSPSSKDTGDGNNKSIYSKVYVIPPATGYFRFVMFPHYALEWLEWFGFMLMGFGVVSAPSSAPGAPGAPAMAAPSIPLAPYYAPIANLLINKWGLSFPFPVIAFLVNSVLTTMARATWGRKWYAERFGEKAVNGRKAAVPYLI